MIVNIIFYQRNNTVKIFCRMLYTQFFFFRQNIDFSPTHSDENFPLFFPKIIIFYIYTQIFLPPSRKMCSFSLQEKSRKIIFTHTDALSSNSAVMAFYLCCELQKKSKFILFKAHIRHTLESQKSFCKNSLMIHFSSKKKTFRHNSFEWIPAHLK